jgi:hypothetical protein
VIAGFRDEWLRLFFMEHAHSRRIPSDLDLWEAMHSPRERERIERARPLGVAA